MFPQVKVMFCQVTSETLSGSRGLPDRRHPCVLPARYAPVRPYSPDAFKVAETFQFFF